VKKLLTLLLLSPLAFAEPKTPYECAQSTGSQEELTKCYNALPDEVKILKKLEDKSKDKKEIVYVSSQQEKGRIGYCNAIHASNKQLRSKCINKKDMTQQDITRQDVKGKIGFCNAMHSSNQQLLGNCLSQIGFIEPSLRAEITKQDESRKQERKKKILADLKQRCNGYGFTGESNISACIQREAQHDKELAMQKYELEKTRIALQQAQSQAQSRAYVQSLPPVAEEEEEIPWLIKFLGDVAIGVAEGYADPAFHRDVQQQKEINQLKANQRRCVHNC
tara:strand:- start:48 stop:881 length:834 start_codon:yes stop_codon:yes gene_type:complete